MAIAKTCAYEKDVQGEGIEMAKARKRVVKNMTCDSEVHLEHKGTEESSGKGHRTLEKKAGVHLGKVCLPS